MSLTESIVEEAALECLQWLGYEYRPGPEIPHDGLFAERKGYADVVLVGRLQSALERLNPNLPPEAIEVAIKQIRRLPSPSVVLS
jgi:type I restriction enzyme, R subunit